ncbi:MAG: phosphate signaling complex protein PhoU [Thermaerobacterales bacterium]
MSTTRGAFQQELAQLRSDVLRMADMVEESIQKSVEALQTQNVALAEQVLAGDDKIDAMEHRIENRSLELLALQQPMAVDLRAIGTALKMVTDLERMADHGVDIAKATKRMADQPYMKPLVDIPRMAEIAREMLRDGVTAYIEGDTALAKAIAERDHSLDHLFGQIFRELLTYMISDPRTIEQATQLLVVASALERVGDHATNLGEWVIYMVTGERMELND